jgi:hypothetical protein
MNTKTHQNENTFYNMPLNTLGIGKQILKPIYAPTGLQEMFITKYYFQLLR